MVAEEVAWADIEGGVHKAPADSDFEYMNVRRLLMFIEASTEWGLAGAVFEPNAERS